MSEIDGALWRQAGEWVERAMRDAQAARLCLDGSPSLPDIASFHCQQAAEKILKAFLVASGQVVPRTHDLARLADQATAAFPIIGDIAHATEIWTVWNTAYRYPSEETGEPWPTRGELQAALATIAAMAAAFDGLGNRS